jgi:hypothetical protein
MNLLFLVHATDEDEGAEAYGNHDPNMNRYTVRGTADWAMNIKGTLTGGNLTTGAGVFTATVVPSTSTNTPTYTPVADPNQLYKRPRFTFSSEANRPGVTWK